MKKLFSLFLFLYAISGMSQSNYYLLTGTKILNETEYKKFKDSISIKGETTEKTVLTFKRNDSIYVLPRLEVRSANSMMEYFDFQTYFERTFKKNINFTKLKSIRSNKNIDDSKPYFINCWFVNCAPCVEEIPDLNELQKEYMGEVNFIAITFDQEDFLKTFLQKKSYNFIHLSNQKALLKKMEISSYPTSFILDKDGNFISFASYGNPMGQIYTKKILKKLVGNSKQ